jgi:CheY-like chemotaxis protein
MKLLDILLIDDDHYECGLFAVAVERADLNIHLQTVPDGDQAIDYLKGRGGYADRSMHPVPDLVVLDLDMNLTGGLEFLDWRRASVSFLSLPVVIFSAFAYSGTINTALAMGAKSFVVKPLEFEGWEASVRRIWDLGMEGIELIRPAFAVGGNGAEAQAPRVAPQDPQERRYG